MLTSPLTRIVSPSITLVTVEVKQRASPVQVATLWPFHTEEVDSLYDYVKNDKAISGPVTFETEPSDAPWGERFFHVREPDGYQLSFERPLSRRSNAKSIMSHNSS